MSFSSFELSVPGHALVATPNHGQVSPLSTLTVSLGVHKSALKGKNNNNNNNNNNTLVLPWSGSLYVNGDDGATVAVKVLELLI